MEKILKEIVKDENIDENFRFVFMPPKKRDEEEETIEDGFGSAWSAWCPTCKKKSMQIVRPGKVQCYNCG